MYRAFISYSREDRDFAMQLHRRLEAYVLPKAMAVQHDGDKNPLKPIFRDEDELVPGPNLPQRLIDALHRSDHLIVVCSPAAAASPWVDREIQAFSEKHGAESILAVVADGVPYSSRNPETGDRECFPPSLRELVNSQGEIVEPLWVDIHRKLSDRRAFLRVVAALLRLESLDELIQRDAARQRQRRLITIAASVAVAIVVTLLGGGLLYQRNEAQTETMRAQSEASKTAIAQARNAFYAGQTADAVRILKNAADAGAGPEVDVALRQVAGWVPDVGDVLGEIVVPALIEMDGKPVLMARNRKTILLPSTPERYVTNADARFAAIYFKNGTLSTYDLTTGALLSSKALEGYSIGSSEPVLLTDLGSMLIGASFNGTTVKSNQSEVVLIGKSGKIRSVTNTFLGTADGFSDTDTTLHLATAPLIMADCKYLGFAKPELTGTIGFEGVKERQNLEDFIYFRIGEEALERLPGLPQATSFYGDAPNASVPPPAPPGEPPLLGTNLDAIWAPACVAVRPERNLSGAKLKDAFVRLGSNADREPEGWWRRKPVPYGEMSPDPRTTLNPCEQHKCEQVGTIEKSADGTPQPTDFSYFQWAREATVRGGDVWPSTLFSGVMAHGQTGHEVVYCRTASATAASCFSVRYYEPTRSAGDFVTPSYVVMFGVGDPDSGITLARLSDWKLTTLKDNENIYAGQLADMSPSQSKLFAIDTSGGISSFAIAWPKITLEKRVTANLLSAFRESSSDQPTGDVPIALRAIGDEYVMIGRADGTLMVVSAASGLDRWQGRLTGLGPLQTIELSPDRTIALIMGEQGMRLISTANGLPLSGIFGLSAGPFTRLSAVPTVDNRGNAVGGIVTRPARAALGSKDAAMTKLAVLLKEGHPD